MHTLKRLLPSSVLTLFFLLILLLSAGRVDYWQAWLYTIVSLAMNAAMVFALRDDTELSKERAKPGAGTQKWDKFILAIGLLLTIVTQVVAGLDTGRYHWSPPAPWILAAFGAFLNILGGTLFLRAMKENRFFSAVARIQKDREQSVCTSGPYRVVRHPGYIGMIIGTLGFPFLFLSIWAAIPTALSIVNLIIRTAMEDRFLSEELAGYKEYQLKTRFRLIPGLW